MLKVRYKYPDDPVAEVTLMFGQEFLLSNPDREMVITSGSSITRIPVEDAICDSCNTNVGLVDPCALSDNSLYCWTCFGEYIKPHLLTEPTGEPDTGGGWLY